MKKVRTIRIDKEVSDKLDSICERHGDISWHIEKALNSYGPIKKASKEVGKPKAASNQFVVPTPQEVGSYFLERGSPNAIDEGDKFCDFYESKKWMVGKNKMASWKAAVRNWMRVKNERQQSANQPSVKQSIGNAIHGATANDW